MFKLNPDGGGYSILRHFSGAGGEGRYPECTLLETPEGMLCGTTAVGGNGEGGAVFTLNKDAGGFTTVKGFYAFAGGGFYRADTLLAASDVKNYGTTVKGGEYNSDSLFRVSVDGSAHQMLHHFGSGLDGVDLRGGLAAVPDEFISRATVHLYWFRRDQRRAEFLPAAVGTVTIPYLRDGMNKAMSAESYFP